MKKYYIFDLDGTLADSMGWWYGSLPRDFRDGDEALEKIRRFMHQKYADTILPKPGALELLERLQKQNVTMCIASATDRWVSEPFIKKYDLGKYFEFYIDCTEVGAKKDKPDIYLEAARRLGAAPQECVVVEDSAYCAGTAHNAGFTVVGVYDVNTAPRGDVSEFSDVYVRELDEYIKMIIRASSE